MGLGNRGMVFEMLINLSNEMYQRGGFIMEEYEQLRQEFRNISKQYWK
nr:hypothetical protein [Bacillus mycoides]